MSTFALRNSSLDAVGEADENRANLEESVSSL